MNENTIPKIIHYCWFGKNPLPETARRCIESWKKFCPDYEITEWNEDNFDVHMNAYTEEAYNAGKWAFVADVARLYALVNFGGIYMDTDVELLKSPDGMLENEAVLGFESPSRIQTAFIASVKGKKFFCDFLGNYSGKHFIKSDNTADMTTNVDLITEELMKKGLKLNNKKQTVDGILLLPVDYLCPLDFDTKELNVTENTVCIHYFDGSWLGEETIYYNRLVRKLMKFMPKKLSVITAKCVSVIRYRGFRVFFSKAFRKIGKAAGNHREKQ